jgi:hypothetical protein
MGDAEKHQYTRTLLAMAMSDVQADSETSAILYWPQENACYMLVWPTSSSEPESCGEFLRQALRYI